MPTVTAPHDVAATTRIQADDDTLRRFLRAYWLRPENALWMTLRSLVLRETQLAPPVADLGCGDGVFSFLHNGGLLDSSFDVFGTVGYLDDVSTRHADMFDFVDGSYRPTVLTPPRTRIDVGVDVKPALLTKAGRLGLYGDLVAHDLNRPLPFAANSLQTLYSNTAYWIREIDGFLTELRRVVCDDGSVILHVKLSNMGEHEFASLGSALGGRFLDILARGRRECWPSLCDRATWERRFRVAGLAVESATPVATKTHAALWDVGLRPIAPLLVKMSAAIAPQTRTAIKEEWVALFSELLAPLARTDLGLGGGSAEACELQYLLRPR